MMENKIDIKEIKWELSNLLMETFLARNINFTIIRLLFLKYAVDNCIGASSKEDMQAYMQVQKAFAMRYVEGGPNVIVPVLDIIDNHYNLSGIIKSSVDDYATELFGLDRGWQRRSTSDQEFKKIMNFLSNLDLTEQGNSFEVGKEIVSVLIEDFNPAYLGRNVGGFTSAKSFGVIGGAILEVNDGEVFYDFASGVGISSIQATKNVDCVRYCNDIDQGSNVVCAMLYIMSGFEKFEITNKNSFSEHMVEEAIKPADKILVDAPIAGRVDNPLRESTLVAMDVSAKSLKEGGKAIVSAASGVLFSTNKKTIEFKAWLVKNGYVQAVVALPINIPGSAVSLSIVVLSKQKNEGVFFVNACSEYFKQYIIKERAYTDITEEGIKQLAQIVKNGEIIEGVSNFVSVADLDAENYNLLPSKYVLEPIKKIDITTKEIDEKLAKLYKNLLNLMD